MYMTQMDKLGNTSSSSPEVVEGNGGPPYPLLLVFIPLICVFVLFLILLIMLIIKKMSRYFLPQPHPLPLEHDEYQGNFGCILLADWEISHTQLPTPLKNPC